MILNSSWQTIDTVQKQISTQHGTYYIYQYLQARLVSQNIETNTSVIEARVQKYNETYNPYYNFRNAFTCTIGTSLAYNQGINQGTYTNPASVLYTSNPITITHNSDGTKTLSIGFTGYIWADTYSRTVSVELPTIPRASSFVTDKDSYLSTENCVITISRASDTFTHSVSWAYGGYTGNIGSDVATSITWLGLDSVQQVMTTSTSGTVVLTVNTYSGSTLIGTSSKNITISIPSNYLPTLTIGNWVLSNGIALAGISTASFTYTTGKTPNNNSAIVNTPVFTATKDYTNVQISNENSITLPSSSVDYSLELVGTINDSRGRTNSASKTLTVYGYTSPRITAVNAYRCEDSTGTVNPSGTYGAVQIQYMISSNEGYSNSATIVVTINEVTKTVTSNDPYGMVTIAGWEDLALDTSYNVKVVLADSYTSVTTQAYSIPKQIKPIFFRDNKQGSIGVGIGQRPNGYRFETFVDSVFHRGVEFEGSFKAQDAKLTGGLDYYWENSLNPTASLYEAQRGILETTNLNVTEKLSIGTAQTSSKLYLLGTSSSEIKPQNKVFVENGVLGVGDGVYEAWEEVWTGTLLSPNSMSLDVSGYSKLRVWYNNYDRIDSFLMDLTTPTYIAPATNYSYSGGGCTNRVDGANNFEIGVCAACVSDDKKTFWNKRQGYVSNGTTYFRDNNSNYFIFRIEGVK